jgi:protein involved in polysaccharide export with SLBB domain
MFSPLTLLVCLLVSCGAAEAQVNASSLLSANSQAITSTNYYFARPNDLTLIVNVMGFVQRPGRYEIGASIDLLNLISLAGGPSADGTLSKVTITRIVKTGNQIQAWKFHVDLEDYSSLKADDLVLSPGDIVYVDRTSWSSIRDAFGIVVSAAALTYAVSQVIATTKK